MKAAQTKDIFLCVDHRDFLQSYLATRKPRMGVRALARKAGFKSPGHLHLLVRGDRRLTLRSAELLAQALALKGKRRALLLAFASLDSSRTETDRELAREQILRLRSSREEFLLNSKQYSFLSIWYYPILYAMLENSPREMDSALFARHLGRGVSALEVARAIDDMLAIDLLEKAPDGLLRTKHVSVATPAEFHDLAAVKYLRNTLHLAEEALSLPVDEREFGGLTVALPHHLLPAVKEKMRALRSELNEMLSRELPASDIYQFNLQLFPVTSNIERKPSCN